jgi:hypothetical protein
MAEVFMVSSRRWDAASTRRAAQEVVGDLVARHEAHALMRLEMLDQALQHQQHLGAAGDIGVDGDGEDRVVVLAVDPVELVAPHLLYVARIDEAVAVGRLLDEHHGRQVVQIPVGGDLDQPCLLAAHQGLHPGVRMLAVVDARPLVAHAHVVRVEVVVHQAVVVLDAFLVQQLVGDRAEFPPRSDVARGRAAGQPRDDFDAAVQHGLFLLGRHGNRVLMAVAVDADFVARVHHGLHLLGKGLGRVARNEPGGLQAVFVEQLEQPQRADLAREHAARDVVGRVFPAIRTKPAADGIDVHAKRDLDFLAHVMHSYQWERWRGKEPVRRSAQCTAAGRHRPGGA